MRASSLLLTAIIVGGCQYTPPILLTPDAATCAAPKANCEGACVDLQRDQNNCGACSKVCDTGQACVAGQCTTTCPPGMMLCSGLQASAGNTICTDVMSDFANCGSCGHACADGTLCSKGQCTALCGQGLTDCNRSCVSLTSDPLNCGQCGTACPMGQACTAGACTGGCPGGKTSCEGACVDLTNDPFNCGHCGAACLMNEACTGSTCVAGCPKGQTSCQGACVDTTSNPMNCGKCGMVCPMGQSCSAGVCMAGCAMPLTDCGGGVCADLTKDPRNCGHCGATCLANETCGGSTCVACMGNQVSCGNACTDLTSDAGNCGACGKACAMGQACVAGACACAAHWGYTGNTGPTHWGTDLCFTTCAVGQMQSPVDLTNAMPAKFDMPMFAYQVLPKFTVKNNGHTIQVDVDPGLGSSLLLGGTTYTLKQFHFHAASEHTVNGKSYPMEIHFVHSDPMGKLLVVGVLVDSGSASAEINAIMAHAPAMMGTQDLNVALDPNKLLPLGFGYYTYSGSLTTPPCTEGVKWVVMVDTITSAAPDIMDFTNIYPVTNRPVQPLNGRTLQIEGAM